MQELKIPAARFCKPEKLTQKNHSHCNFAQMTGLMPLLHIKNLRKEQRPKYEVCSRLLTVYASSIKYNLPSLRYIGPLSSPSCSFWRRCHKILGTPMKMGTPGSDPSGKMGTPYRLTSASVP